MDEDLDIQKRADETKYDHYPLKRMLPQFSVYNIFFQNYKQEKNKAIFLDNHKYLKLREGYFSLFACKAFDEIEKRKHYLFFPDEKDGDVAFIAEVEDRRMEICHFDIKEYHQNDPKSFSEFLNAIFSKPKIQNNYYGLIICVNRDVQIDQNSLDKILSISKTLSRGIFLCSAASESEYNPNKSMCRYFVSGEIYYSKVITIDNLEDGVTRDDILIYQDVINY